MAGKKHDTKRPSEETPDPYYYEREYSPTGLIGKMLGLHPKHPKPNREGKGDRQGVGMSDIREKYRKDEGK
jgi:hypothetical protein